MVAAVVIVIAVLVGVVVEVIIHPTMGINDFCC